MKKITKSLVMMLSVGLIGSALVGCKGKNAKDASITLSTEFVGTEVQRHESIQFTVELKEVKAEDVTYSVSSEVASFDAAGKLTVKDDAAVGTEFSVTASAGSVTSNALSFEVVDTMPTQLRATPSATSLKEDSEVSFSVSYLPVYATVREYNVEILEGAEIAEFSEKKLRLKEGVVSEEHVGEEVKVKVFLVSDPTIKHELTFRVGVAGGSILLKNLTLIARKSETANVSPALYDENGNLVTNPEFPFAYASSNADVFTVSEEGVITAKGHGTATLTVTYGDLSETATINVIVSPKEIEATGLSSVIRDRDFKFAKGATFTLNLEESKEDKYAEVSHAYKYDLKLLDDEGAVVSDDDQAIATIDNNKFTFKQVGRVQLDVLSNSSLAGEEVADEYEAKTTIFFDVNDGVNVSSLAELKTALNTKSVRDVNLVKTIDVATEDLSKSDNNQYVGINSYGNKRLNGNGFELDMSKVALTTPNSKEVGASFITFLPDFESGADAHAPFTVEIYDFALLGNTDYNGQRLNGGGEENAFYPYGDWTGFYRAGLTVGRFNSKYNWNDKGTLKQEGYYNAYVNEPVLTNVRVEGFYWGLWMHHNVDGVLTNVHTVNASEKGILAEQCTLTLVNPSFGKNGAFCIEVTQDGVNNMNRTAAPEGKEDLYKTEPQAGKNYNEPSTLNMTGDIRVNNMTTGTDTTYLYAFSQQMQATLGVPSIPALANMIFDGRADGIVDFCKAEYGIDSDTGDALKADLMALATSIFYDNPSAEAPKTNFFALSFMQDLDLLHHTDESVDDYALVKENDKTAIKMTDILKDEANAFLQSGGQAHTTLHETHQYVDIELKAGVAHLGKLVSVNNLYSEK